MRAVTVGVVSVLALGLGADQAEARPLHRLAFFKAACKQSLDN